MPSLAVAQCALFAQIEHRQPFKRDGSQPIQQRHGMWRSALFHAARMTTFVLGLFYNGFAIANRYIRKGEPAQAQL